MKKALWHIFDDVLSATLFLVAYALSGKLFAAIAVAAFAGFVPVAWRVLRRRPVEPLKWANFGLVLVLAAASWLAASPRFVMARPSVVHFALAAAMWRAGWLLPYLNRPARENVPRAVIVAAGHAWAALMAVLGFTNLIIALYFDLAVWAWFVIVISVGAKLCALALQYAVFRSIRRRRSGRAANLGPRVAK
jgi:intracellular septation protein A